MNTHAFSGYGAVNSPIKDSRTAEAQLLQRLTGAMEQASHNPADFPGLVRAISDNQTFWHQIAFDLASDENRLPVPLKAGLLSLAAFTEKHTSRILAGKADVTPLLDMNRTIIRGLMGQGAAA